MSELYDYIEFEFKPEGVVLRGGKQAGQHAIGPIETGTYKMEGEDLSFVFADGDVFRAKCTMRDGFLHMEVGGYSIIFRRIETTVKDEVPTTGFTRRATSGP